MTVHEELATLIALYCHFCDDGRFDAFAELFTEDAQFVVMGQVHHGRDAIKAFMQAAQPPQRRGKHITSNAVFVVDPGGERAEGKTDYVFLARSGDSFAIQSVGRYHDQFVRQNGRWRFARREIVFFGE
ncbi:MAG: nuclear transport factor 2 family protein [Acidimicrobiales bacterium]|nr:nuclear transport factor 2 family protein [Acidimicrobiales bacterium]